MQDSRKPGDPGLMAQWRATGGADAGHGDSVPGDDGLAASVPSQIQCHFTDDGLAAYTPTLGHPGCAGGADDGRPTA